jgi:hypothetical protein
MENTFLEGGGFCRSTTGPTCTELRTSLVPFLHVRLVDNAGVERKVATGWSANGESEQPRLRERARYM